MKTSVVIALVLFAVGCVSQPVAEVHSLDGKSVVLEGRWNALAKAEGQLICSAEPTVVDVIGIGDLPTPKHQQMVRVSAVLHWQGLDPKVRRSLRKEAIQLGFDGYVIRWPEAQWVALP